MLTRSNIDESKVEPNKNKMACRCKRGPILISQKELEPKLAKLEAELYHAFASSKYFKNKKENPKKMRNFRRSNFRRSRKTLSASETKPFRPVSLSLSRLREGFPVVSS